VRVRALYCKENPAAQADHASVRLRKRKGSLNLRPTLRNYTRDEGGPFEVGNHGPISSRCKLLRSKAVVVSVAVKLGPKVQDGKVERGERKRTADEVSKD
jgi:hypothetical protein